MHQSGVQTPAPDDRISVAAAAAILGKNRATIVRWIKAGKLTGTKLGDNTSAWLLNAAEVQALANGDGEAA